MACYCWCLSWIIQAEEMTRMGRNNRQYSTQYNTIRTGPKNRRSWNRVPNCLRYTAVPHRTCNTLSSTGQKTKPRISNTKNKICFVPHHVVYCTVVQAWYLGTSRLEITVEFQLGQKPMQLKILVGLSSIFIPKFTLHFESFSFVAQMLLCGRTRVPRTCTSTAVQV